MQQFFSAMFAWNRVAPYQCLLTDVRGQSTPVIYHQGKLHLIIPNNEYEPFIRGADQGLIINAVVEGLSWNDIDCTISKNDGFDGGKMWSCLFTKGSTQSSGCSKNLYLAMVNCFSSIMQDLGAVPADTDPVFKANFSIPCD